MKIVMFLEKALIDSVKIEKHKLTRPGYLSGCVRQLKDKHRDLLLQSTSEPEFFLFTIREILAGFKDEITKLGLPFNLIIKN